MEWSEEETERCARLLQNVAGRSDADLNEVFMPFAREAAPEVLSLAAELLAAREGILTAEAIAPIRHDFDLGNKAIWEKAPENTEALLAHSAAQGARNATLEHALAELEEIARNGTCLLAGPGRGDCEHAVGLPGPSIPGQHDGPDDTVDAYGKPNGWCWMCWRGKKVERAEVRISALTLQVAELERHVWALNAALEQAQQARDQSEQSAEVWRTRVERAAESLADVLPEEVDRLDLLVRIQTLKDAVAAARMILARPRPSGKIHLPTLTPDVHAALDAALGMKQAGQVAEDVERVSSVLGVARVPAMYADAQDALSRLAAKARGYEAALRERDAAVARAEEAEKQARLAWERQAEKDRAYGDMISQRDAALADRTRFRAQLDSLQTLQAEQRDSALREVGVLRARHDAAMTELEACKKQMAEHMRQRDVYRQDRDTAASLNIQLKRERDAAVADNAAWKAAALAVAPAVAVLARSPEVVPDIRSVLLEAEAAFLANAKAPHPGVVLLEELATLRGIRAQAQADAKFVHEALGWAGEWPISLPAPSRAVVTLLERMRAMEQALCTCDVEGHNAFCPVTVATKKEEP